MKKLKELYDWYFIRRCVFWESLLYVYAHKIHRWFYGDGVRVQQKYHTDWSKFFEYYSPNLKKDGDRMLTEKQKIHLDEKTYLFLCKKYDEKIQYCIDCLGVKHPNYYGKHSTRLGKKLQKDLRKDDRMLTEKQKMIVIKQQLGIVKKVAKDISVTVKDESFSDAIAPGIYSLSSLISIIINGIKK